MKLDFTAFKTAKDNMDYDRELASIGDATTRIYTWETPSITYPEKRPGECTGWGFDTSDRPTGGGILFHSPGSIVFSVIEPVTSIKKQWSSSEIYMGKINAWITGALLQLGIEAVAPTTDRPPDPTSLAYCASYHNPFELTVNGDKIAGIALRKWRQVILVQGIIHTVSNRDYFSHIDGVAPYLSGGVDLRYKDRLQMITILGQTANTA